VGLDTYAARVPVDFFDPDLDETGIDEWFGLTRRDRWALRRLQRQRERMNDGYCLFSDNYFRGKIYDDVVRYVTGVSLYAPWIPPDTVKQMSEALERRDAATIVQAFQRSEQGIRDHSATEVADLQAFFKLCADRGLGLVGSW